MSQTILVNDPRVEPFVREKAKTGVFTNYSSIGLERDGEVIAGCVYNLFNGVSCHVSIAAKCGSRWCSRGIIRVMMGYALVGMNLKRITATVAESNKVSCKFVEKLGFVLEAKLIDSEPDGALCVYRMLKSECRWL